MKIVFSAPLLELIQDPEVQAKVDDVARFFYSNNSVTINLAAVAAAAALGLLCKWIVKIKSQENYSIHQFLVHSFLL